MADRMGAAQEAPLFAATLKPHRSLGRTGFLVVMGVLCAVSFAAGIAFTTLGAWPVLGFFGLDVLLVYLAFHLSYRAGRMIERIEVDRERLTLVRVHPSGARENFEFQTYWVRVLDGLDAQGRDDLRLASHGRSVSFAAFLSPQERQSFAKTLSAAIHDARRGRA
jgi:uncharacterized membrane protein